MYYNSSAATSDKQDEGNLTLAQILTGVQALGGDPSTLAAILAALAPLATATKQDTGNTTLASILSALAALSTASKQDTGNTTLASILSALAPLASASKQDIGNASLASIDAKIGSSSSAITSVTQSPSIQTILAANANRKGFALYNDSGVKCYVALGSGATISNFSVLLAPNSGYEPIQTAVYKGLITCIWASGTSGAMRVTEFT